MGGLEAAQDLAQVEPAAVEPAAGVADQQRQVVARVGVELGEDLVRVDVRRGRLDRDREALAGGGRLVAARLEVDEHVLEAGLGPQQRAGVLPDHALVLGVDDHLDHGLAVLQLDVADVADADAGDAHGLALARGDGLGGRELGLQDQRRLLPREAHALLVEQVEGDAGGHGDEAEHGERLLRMLPDRGHRPTCAATWSMSCWSASPDATSRIWSRPSAFSWSRSQSTAFVLGLRVAGLEGRRAGVDLPLRRRAGGVGAQVRRLLRLTRLRGVERRALRRARRVGADQRLGRGGEHAGPQRDEVLAAGGQHAEPRAVGVARAALAREARKRLGRLLVDLALGGELLVGHRVHRPRVDDGVLAARRAADLAVERDAAVDQGGQVGHGRAQVGGQAAQLGLGHQAAQLLHERQRDVERLLGALDPRAQLARQRAQRREGLVERLQRRHRGVQRVRQLADGRAQVAPPGPRRRAPWCGSR